VEGFFYSWGGGGRWECLFIWVGGGGVSGLDIEVERSIKVIPKACGGVKGQGSCAKNSWMYWFKWNKTQNEDDQRASARMYMSTRVSTCSSRSSTFLCQPSLAAIISSSFCWEIRVCAACLSASYSSVSSSFSRRTSSLKRGVKRFSFHSCPIPPHSLRLKDICKHPVACDRVHLQCGVINTLAALITSVGVRQRRRDVTENGTSKTERKWDRVWRHVWVLVSHRSASLHFWSKSSAILSIFCFSSVLMEITLASCCCRWVSISSCEHRCTHCIITLGSFCRAWVSTLAGL